MYVRITLLKTQIDEENIFVGESLYDMYNKLRALTDKKEHIGSFNPNDPFRIGLNYFLLDRRFNYAIFEFSDTLEAFENRDIINNEDLTRFYFIRGFEFVNDNVTRLVVKEDILAKQFYPIKNQTVKCIPSRFTYPDTVLNKRNFQSVAGSGLFNVRNEISIGLPTFFSEDSVYLQFAGKRVFFGALVVTFITSESSEFGGGYTENNISYPFYNALLPFAYEEGTNKILPAKFTFSYADILYSVSSIGDAIDFFKQETAGFSVVSSVFIPDIKSLGLDIAEPLDAAETFNILIRDKLRICLLTPFRYGEKVCLTVSQLSLFRYSPNEYSSVLNNEFVKELSFPQEISSYFLVSPYSKITFELCGQKIEIDPRMINLNIYGGINFTMFQSLVPPYAVTVDFLYDSNDITRLNYSNRGCFKLENSNSFMSFLDSYTEFIRTNYNAKITGLSVQQSNQNAILASQQASEQAALSRQIDANFATAGVNAATGVLGSIAGTVGGLMIASPTTLMNPLQNVGAGLSAIGGLANTEISAGAQGDIQGITQAQQREALSLNQQKERAMLELQLQDLRNTPDQISISNSPTLFLDMRAYARVTLWINERIDEILFNHKIYGYSAPEMITDLKAHTVFDYIRTNNIIFFNNEITGFYPSTADMLIIQDTFSKGVRVWYKLDKIKDYDNINNGSV